LELACTTLFGVPPTPTGSGLQLMAVQATRPKARNFNAVRGIIGADIIPLANLSMLRALAVDAD
jgi:hypothetical protein